MRLFFVVNSVGYRDLCVYSCLFKLKLSFVPRFLKMMHHEIKQHSFCYSWAWKKKQNSSPFHSIQYVKFWTVEQNIDL